MERLKHRRERPDWTSVENTHCVWFGITVGLHHVKGQVFLVHKLLRAYGTLKNTMFMRTFLKPNQPCLDLFCALILFIRRRPNLVWHISRVGDDMQAELFFPIERRGTRQACVLLSFQHSTNLVFNFPGTSLDR